MIVSLTTKLTAQIRAKTISETDRRAAALFALDAIGSAFAGRNTVAGRTLLQWSSAQGNDAGRAAFAVAGLTHIVETDDLHRASVTHPGCVVLPTVIAMSNRCEYSARNIIDAVLHGFEAMCRVGMAVGKQHYKIWHNTATCGPYGAAMAAAALLRLDDEQCVNALGNAGTQSSGLWEFLDSGAMSKHLHAARAAESGLVAAQLASLGFTGPPKILEGTKGFFAGACPDAEPDQITAEFAGPWQLRQTSIKPWPSCRHTHAVIDAALALHGQCDPRSIRDIQINTYPAALDLCDRPQPDSEYAAKFSLQHCVATAIAEGSVTLNSFDTAARNKTDSLRRTVTLNSEGAYAAAYPLHWGASITVTLTDRSTLQESRSDSRGDPDSPISESDMTTKIDQLLEFGGLSAGRSKQIIADVLALANDDADTTVLNTILPELLAT